MTTPNQTTRLRDAILEAIIQADARHTKIIVDMINRKITAPQKATDLRAPIYAETADKILALLDVRGWQDMSEAPRDGSEFLVTWKHKGQFYQAVAYFELDEHGNEGWLLYKNNGLQSEIESPFGWQPLPQPPAQDGE